MQTSWRRDIITFVSRRRPLAIQLVGLGAMCGSLCACGTTSESPPRMLNDKVIAAVKANDVEAVRMLLQQGAPVDARAGEGSDEGYTALLYAVEHQFLPLTRLLLRSGADPTLPAGHQDVFPLLKAARAGDRHMLVLLLDYRAKINQKRPGDGMDALAIACSRATCQLWTCSWPGTLRSNRRTSVTRSALGTSRSPSGCWTPAWIPR